MSLQPREKRAVILGAAAVAGILLYRISFNAPQGTAVLAASDTVAMAEKRVAKLRQMAALVPGKQGALAKVQAELISREKGILVAETPQQAQAQLFQIMRRVMKAQAPPIDIASTEIGQTRALDDNYGEVMATVSFNCRIEDLVNLLTDLTKQKELIATSEMRIGSANPKEKNMPVRLTISGVVRRELIPDKKGNSAF